MMVSFYKRLALIGLIVLAGMVGLSGCSDNSAAKPDAQQQGKAPKKVSKPIPVEVMQAEIGNAASYYVTTSTLTPSSDAQVKARSNGVVRKILREEGDDVGAGEILLQLEDDDQRLRVQQAQQKLASAEREFKRINKMKKSGMLSPAEWEEANNIFQTAQTDLQLAELALTYTRIASPFAGRVVWREVDLGAHVSAGDLLFRIMAINPLLVKVHVPANRIGKVAAGQMVKLRVDSSAEPLSGVIDLVSPIVDPATGTIKVTVKLEAYPSNVRPGDFTEITMITDQRANAMLLPSVALIEERGQHYVFVNDNSKAVRKKVEIGYVVGEQTEIISGITQADKIVVKGQRSLNEGNLLKVIGAEGATDLANQQQNSKSLVDSSNSDAARSGKQH
ncbi:efflux RND transporter periplasmic adaptor subunit [Aliikangiella maris]|uniref:Efflux RND transporter periplasmic adaptor subunit n=2 Tax=Aliikangiella maris TaxID=3162458 RepID=A0ABV3MK57_9GAMM